MKSKKTKMNPAEALGDMQRAKMGVAKGSMLEGGGIVYGDDKKKKATGNMKDYPIGSSERYNEYKARGWKQDDTTKGGESKKGKKQITKPMLIKAVKTGLKGMS